MVFPSYFPFLQGDMLSWVLSRCTRPRFPFKWGAFNSPPNLHGNGPQHGPLELMGSPDKSTQQGGEDLTMERVYQVPYAWDRRQVQKAQFCGMA